LEFTSSLEKESEHDEQQECDCIKMNPKKQHPWDLKIYHPRQCGCKYILDVGGPIERVPTRAHKRRTRMESQIFVALPPSCIYTYRITKKRQRKIINDTIFLLNNREI